VVPGAEGLLLYDHGSWLCDYSFARDHNHSATDAFPNTTTYATAYSTRNTLGASRSFQLRCRCREHLGSGQERVVLPYPSPWMPTDRAPTAAHRASNPANYATEASGSLQL